MFAEAAEAPEAVRRQLAQNRPLLSELGGRLRASPPRAVFTFARGSSDNAATYGRYLIETRLGVVTGSSAPSVASVYEARPGMSGMLCLAVSQSGRSPDLVAQAEAAREAGGLVVALVNDPGSPLAEAAEVVVQLSAGPELSVAATKSYIASLSALAQLTALWSGDEALLAGLEALPEQLEHAFARDWSRARGPLAGAQSLYVVGRGVGFSVAQEAALKFKETCGLHAEAFSAAELRHGPMALVERGFPVLVFAQDDETREGVDAVAEVCLARHAIVLKAGGAALLGAVQLPSAPAHPALEPIGFALSFYRMAADLALARGFDPDRPPNLKKVTETL